MVHNHRQGQEALFSENMPLSHCPLQGAAVNSKLNGGQHKDTPGLPKIHPCKQDQEMKVKKMVAARLVKAIKHLPYSLSRERTVLGLKREGFPWRIHSAPEQQVGAPPHPRKGLTKMCPWRWETEATVPRSPTNVRSVPSPSGISLGSNCIREDAMRGPWFAPVWQRLLPGLGPPCASADSRA